jgi:hypothetical protein
VRSRPLATLLLLTGALLAGTIAGAGAPVGAIETATFGLDVADDTADGRLHVAVRAGEATSGRARVWNKTDAPITLALTVVPAQMDADGKVSLGGEGESVSWVDLEPRRVELAARAERTIDVRVRAPRKIDGDTQVVAIQVEPALSPTGATPAVVQRLALTTYLEPDQDSLIAGLGPYPWIALVAVLLVGAFGARAAWRRRLGTPAVDP